MDRQSVSERTLPVEEAAPSEIVIDFAGHGFPPGLNQTRGRHWGSTTAERKRWHDLAEELARATKLRVTEDCRAHLHWDVWCGSWAVRDEDNFRASMKAVQDGLVSAGLIRGDSVWDITTSYLFYPYSRGDDAKSFRITISALAELPDKPVKKARPKVV